MLHKLSIALIVFGSLPSWAQPAQGPQAFEAAAVHLSKGQNQPLMGGGPGTRDPGQITYSNVTLTSVIRKAYDVREYQIQGKPAWLDSERFEIIAKVPEGASKEDLTVMLQGLLADRFKLAVHRETHEGKSYDLVVDKGGPKLKASNREAPEHGTLEVDDNGRPQIPPGSMGRPITLGGKHIVPMVSRGIALVLANSQPMSALAGTLEWFMEGPVRDLTGLTGVYDFTLSFSPPAGMHMPPMGPPGECATCMPNAEPPLTIFQELREKLGLRLDATRGPIDMLVIDHAEKAPTEN